MSASHMLRRRWPHALLALHEELARSPTPRAAFCVGTGGRRPNHSRAAVAPLSLIIDGTVLNVLAAAEGDSATAH